MTNILEQTEPAIVRGIKTVGVGKRGSKPLDPQLAAELLADLQDGKVSAAAQGAFFAGLSLKGVAESEMLLARTLPAGILTDPRQLAEHLTQEAPAHIRDICIQLLEKKELSYEQSRRLGEFLFSDLPGDSIRGLVASALRVRYETADEYHGLWESMQATISPAFRQPVPEGQPIIQIAEPFDGVDHSFLLTPLIANHLQTLPYRVIHMAGRNSGPKLGINLLELARELKMEFAESNSEVKGDCPAFGWCISQEKLTPAVDRWVEIRRQTVKRPFLATLEKFLNPAKAEILITSAFHPNYGEKMLTIAERAGFPTAIVVSNGLEGTLAFCLNRPAKILCSARAGKGGFHRAEISISPKAVDNSLADYLREEPVAPTLTRNAELVREFASMGKTDDPLFDKRVSVTQAGIDQAIEWVRHNLNK